VLFACIIDVMDRPNGELPRMTDDLIALVLAMHEVDAQNAPMAINQGLRAASLMITRRTIESEVREIKKRNRRDAQRAKAS
jgi:hypothetical protein